MKRKDAYKLLGIGLKASKEEANKAFRNIAAKCHPDIDPSPEAAEKFKLVNEANQRIQNDDFKEPQPFVPGKVNIPFDGFNHEDLFNAIRYNQIEQLVLHITITAKEFAVGCKKEISYKRKNSCNYCNGKRKKPTHKQCVVCSGLGKTSISRGPLVITQICYECLGLGKSLEDCSCNTGYIEETINHSIDISPGELNKVIKGLGNNRQDLLVSIHVTDEPGIEILPDLKTLSAIDITLLEALKGTEKDVNTLKGYKKVKIPAKVKNGNFLRLEGLGVGDNDHHVLINVNYPDNVEDLIKVLDDIGSSKENN